MKNERLFPAPSVEGEEGWVFEDVRSVSMISRASLSEAPTPTLPRSTKGGGNELHNGPVQIKSVNVIR